MLKGILQLLKPDSGKVSFAGQTLKQVRPKLAYMPQKGNVNWDFPTTVLDVATMGRYVHLGWLKRPTKADREKSLASLEVVGMTDYLDRQISELSGGKKQRVFLARALAQDPEYLVLDEPLQGVDIQTEQTIIDTLKSLRDQGKTILVVHHNLYNVADIFDYTILLNHRLVAAGTPKQVLNYENLTSSYGDIIAKNFQNWQEQK